MTYLDLSNKKIYNCLLQYILKECNEITFHFPFLDEKAYNTDELVADYKKYMNEKRLFLRELFNHGATQERSCCYQGIKLGYETQIIRVKLYPKLIERIKNFHLYDWVWWNGLPEDPCFFAEEKCRFVTVSHEGMFYINDDTKDYLLIRQIEK